MIYLTLALSFFKIGLFAFGGGYAMIPLMQAEIEANGWIAPEEFADIVAISQMTPGPIAVNAATYIGYRTAGVLGSASATIGVFLPSLILVLLVAHFVGKFKESPVIRSVLSGIRPATIGLIASAVLFFSELSILTGPLGLETLGGALLGRGAPETGAFALNPGGVIIFAVVLIGTLKLRLHPIAAVLLSMGLGVALM